MPSERLERQRRLDFRRRTAPHDPATYGFRPDRSRARHAARLELVGDKRRGGRLRAEHPQRVRRRGTHRAGRWRHTGSERRPICSAGQRGSESAQGPRRAGMGRHQGIRAVWHPAPVSPASSQDPAVVTGRALFASAGCATCHGGSQWTRSRIDHTPPPGASLISNTQLISQLRQVGTFNPAAFNEVRATAAPPLGADGFVPPSLISIFAFPRTFFHNGAADSLAAVLNNVTHRSAGTGGVDTLTNATDRQLLVDFLLSIDAGTVPFP